jgi:hypothetical protein
MLAGLLFSTMLASSVVVSLLSVSESPYGDSWLGNAGWAVARVRGTPLLFPMD